MEALLRLSGLLAPDEEGKTDLGSLEQRLAEQAVGFSSPGANSNASLVGSAKAESHHGTPQQANLTVPGSGSRTNSPQNAKDEHKSSIDEEVEDLSDMMCSLVTNNQGESRYIGRPIEACDWRGRSNIARLFVRSFHLFASWHQLGQRKDWRRFIPEHDSTKLRRRQQMVSLATRGVWRHLQPARI